MVRRVLIVFVCVIVSVVAGKYSTYGEVTYPYGNLNIINTLKGEYYDVKGDTASSPYRFEGFKPYNETNFRLEYRRSPYDLWRASLQGVISDSEYRSQDDKVILERFNIFHEKGDVSVPYRFEVGDYFGYFSYRTLQRPLKGFQVELQPLWGVNRGLRHSFVVLGGANQPGWNHFNLKENLSAGASYLLKTHHGRYSLNMVYNKRYADSVNFLNRKQVTTSIAIEERFRLLKQPLILETEIGHFHGDHEDLSGSGSGQDRQGWGVFVQLKNSGGSPLSYRFRYENYGEHYRPEGAVITPDRRAYEVHLGYRFMGGVNVRSRFQRFKNNLHSNATTTDVAGLNIAGVLRISTSKTLSTNVDLFIQDTEASTGEDTIVKSAHLDFVYPIFRNINTRLGYSYTDNDDRTYTREGSLGLDLFYRMRGFRISLSPSISYRDTDSSNYNENTMNMGLMWTLQGRRQSINANVVYINQKVVSGSDVKNFNYGLTYTYRLVKSVFSLEFRGDHRNPEVGRSTDAYKVACLWTYYFGRKIGGVKRKEIEKAEEAKELVKRIDIGLMGYIYPGQRTDSAIKKLQDLKAGRYVTYGNALVYETRVFEELDRRQRLVVVDEGGTVGKVAVIFDSVEDGRTLLEDFEKVKEAIIKVYGSPGDFYERGEVSNELLDDIRSGRFIRVYEWRMPAGVLRLGIPARIDEQVRIEVQYAKGFPPYNYTFWSLEGIK